MGPKLEPGTPVVRVPCPQTCKALSCLTIPLGAEGVIDDRPAEIFQGRWWYFVQWKKAEHGRWRISGHALGEIAPLSDGVWTDEGG